MEQLEKNIIVSLAKKPENNEKPPKLLFGA